jgi:hypothetical protein
MGNGKELAQRVTCDMIVTVIELMPMGSRPMPGTSAFDLSLDKSNNSLLANALRAKRPNIGGRVNLQDREGKTRTFRVRAARS